MITRSETLKNLLPLIEALPKRRKRALLVIIPLSIMSGLTDLLVIAAVAKLFNKITNPGELDKESETFKKLFPKIFNPDFNSYCILDHTFQYYSNALKEFISRAPKHVNTINATEGGSIFGDRITSMKFKDFLSMNRN